MVLNGIRPSLALLLATIGLAGGLLLVCAREYHRVLTLQKEIAEVSRRSADLRELENQRDRLLAQTPSESELEQLRRDHDEIVQLQESLRKLGNRTVVDELFRRALDAKRPTQPSPSAGPEKPSFARDRGCSAPLDTLGTVIWAASRGDVEALAPLITFEPAGHAKAQAFYEKLPADARAEYGSAERVYATLLAAAIPLGISNAEKLDESATSADEMTLRLRLERPRGDGHPSDFKFRRSGDRWQLVVPDRIVDAYTRALGDKTAPERT